MVVRAAKQSIGESAGVFIVEGICVVVHVIIMIRGEKERCQAVISTLYSPSGYIGNYYCHGLALGHPVHVGPMQPYGHTYIFSLAYHSGILSTVIHYYIIPSLRDKESSRDA